MNRVRASLLCLCLGITGTACYGDSAGASAGTNNTAISKPMYYSDYLKPGHGVIEGHLFYHTRMFGSQAFANREVDLKPDSAYNYSEMKILADGLQYNNNKQMNYDQSLIKYNRYTNIDSNGYFKFSNLPAGSYLLTSLVRYEDDQTHSEMGYTYSRDIDGNEDAHPTVKQKVKLRVEVDMVFATVTLESPTDRFMVDAFDIMGGSVCCDGQL